MFTNSMQIMCSSRTRRLIQYKYVILSVDILTVEVRRSYDSYLYNEISYTGKKTNLYWIRVKG